MEFEKIKRDIENIGLDNKRVDNDDYMEAVVKKESIGKIMHLLEGMLGKPAWPSQNKLSRDADKIVKNFGGLRHGQTFFFLNKDGSLLFAILWPWQDGERITVKIGKA